jgi:hypothetical protein
MSRRYSPTNDTAVRCAGRYSTTRSGTDRLYASGRHQPELVPRSRPSVSLSHSNGNEPRLREHPLRGDVLVAGRRPERPQPILLMGNAAEAPQPERRHALTRYPLRDAIPDLRGPIHDVVQIETAHHRLVVIDEDVIDAGAGLLLGQELSESLREMLIEIVVTVADPGGEVGPVHSLKIENRCLVVGAKTLQLEHL